MDEGVTAPSRGSGGPLARVTDRSFQMPKHLVLSAWTEHAPFAFWLVEAHQPRTIVELGTHNGLSYFVLCQAVEELGLDSRCYAVDTWAGDEHAGFYSEEVYELVSRVNEDHYSAFSRLVRSTFDEAVEYFDDGSIDLLHIDGRHFYEDVRHDFETWFPKLSDRAVVLFHDTNVRERGFGVHSVWAEIRDRHMASVEFLHGHGLGVLQVGTKVGDGLADWFREHQEPGTLASLRAQYARLGRGVLDRFQVGENSLRVEELREKLRDANAAIERRNEQIQRLEADGTRDREALLVAQRKVGELTARLRETEGDLLRAKQELRTVTQSKSVREAELRASSSRAEAESARADDLARRLQRLRSRRAVRFGLTLARVFHPVFRVVRKARKPVDPRGSSRDSAIADKDRVPGLDRAPTRDGASAAYPPERMKVEPDRDSPSQRAHLERVGMPTIAIPIFNAPRELARCLASIERHTTVPASLLLINDASTDPAVQEVLEPWRHRPNVRVIDNSTNRGFTATVNRAFEESDDDVVVLNSDTEVSPNWLQSLRRAAYEDASIATVTPLSDNSGAFSVPEVGVLNPSPVHLGVDGVARLIARGSLHARPETPTGNGFCWFVKRPVIRSIGGLDATAFPRGYGEENDFCLRASQSGWRHVVDDASFVAHIREASFGAEKQLLVEAGRKVLDGRYPEYGDQVRAFVHGDAMKAVRGRVRSLLEDPPANVRPRVLYVAQIGQGGTPATARDLASAIRGWEALLFESDGREVRLLRIDGDHEEVLERMRLSEPVRFADRQHEEYDAALAGVIRRYGIEMVHVRHLIKQPLSAPRVASALGVPVVLSFHDYYFSCPTVQLLDDEGRFCGGTCTSGMGPCKVPMPWISDDVPKLKHAWVHTWRELVGEVLKHVDAFVTTSLAAREVMTRSLPQLAYRRFEVIEHGRDLPRLSLATSVLEAGPVRVLVPGSLDDHKGGQLLRGIKSIDVEGRLEFHFLGNVSHDASSLGVVHGPYERGELASLVRDIEPSFAAILSPWGETYSHTLTEAWSLGLPVVACDEGALAERVKHHGGGLLVPPHDPETAYRTMLQLADEPTLHRRLAHEANQIPLRSVEEMAQDYDELYLDVVHTRRRFIADERRTRIGLLVPGGSDASRWTGTTHIRFDRRYRHPRIRECANVRYLDNPRELWTQELDTVMVLRNGARGEGLDELLEAAGETGCRVVLDLDDALTEDELFPDQSPWRKSASDIARLAVAADGVTVSTDALRRLISDRYNPKVELVPNALDERIWFAPTEVEAQEDDRPWRILYFGTATHQTDLELMREVLPRLCDRCDREVRLEIVGVAPSEEDDGWYDRLAVPDRCKPYPEFVRWLRRHRARWDVGVAPLVTGGLNDFKSDLKFLELSALGLPTVASRVPAYSGSIQHEKTGILVDNRVTDWVTALARLYSEPAAATRLAQAAQSYVLRERAICRESIESLPLF